MTLKKIYIAAAASTIGGDASASTGASTGAADAKVRLGAWPTTTDLHSSDTKECTAGMGTVL